MTAVQKDNKCEIGSLAARFTGVNSLEREQPIQII